MILLKGISFVPQKFLSTVKQAFGLTEDSCEWGNYKRVERNDHRKSPGPRNILFQTTGK